MTTKQKIIQEVIDIISKECDLANQKANEIYEKLEKGELELTDFSRAVGYQSGVVYCLSIACRLWDKFSKEDDK